jgi:hypothetical protein
MLGGSVFPVRGRPGAHFSPNPTSIDAGLGESDDLKGLFWLFLKKITISLKSKALWYKLQSALVRSIFVTRKTHADTVAEKFPSLP